MSPASDLLFCTDCGNLLDLPSQADFISCNQCNKSHSCADLDKNYKVVTKTRQNAFSGRRLNLQEEEEEEYSGAIIDETCNKCGHGKMKFFTMQLRSADEGQTVFYTCCKCEYTYSLNS